MASSEQPNYLKAAFANVYNLSLLGGAAVMAFATGDWFIGAAAVGVEALWLLVGPDFKPFQRAVNRLEREEREKNDRLRVQKLMETLPEREWARAHALDELRREIERDMQHNPSFQAVLMQAELDKLSQLHTSFVTLANACVRAEAYLGAVDRRDLERQMNAQKSMQEKGGDSTVVELARKNAAVLQKRLDTIVDIENFLARARGQMTLIENSVRLLRDQALTMASPAQLGEQLDDLLHGVDAIAQSAKDTEALVAGMQFDPVAPITAGDDRASTSTGRVQSR
ncbi:MAG: hypothetical protein K1X64_21555 [Myxococcaceae bacterium]|nr:hypothetical protein [Myxococcaceae bacterium]